MRRVVFFLFSLTFLSGLAFAIGIGPPRINIDFTPSFVADLDYIVVNTIDQPIDAILYVSGDLAQYITLDKERVSLPPRARENFRAHIQLPASIAPGAHNIRIGALETAPGGIATVGARAGVESELIITAPFAGKLIQVTASASDISLGSTETLSFSVKSVGNETINELYAVSEIKDASGNAVASLESPKRSLQIGETITIELSWTPQSKGSYTAHSRVIFDGNEEAVVSAFKVGDISLVIEDISISPFSFGQIAKVTITARNEWNQRLSGVYAVVSVLEGTAIVSSAQSRDASIEPFSTGTLEAFVDTAGLEAKEYSAKAVAYYSGKTTEKDFIFKGSSAQGPASDLPIIISVIGIFGLALVVGTKWMKGRKREISASWQ